MIYDNVLQAMGNTPLVRLKKAEGSEDADILVKFEGVNVGGSIKTRTAYNMILDAGKNGIINSNSVIVEPTSGNQGIGLALVGAVLGYRVIIVMPDSVSEERQKLVKQYGAEVVVVEDHGDIGECIDNCLKTAIRIADETPGGYVPQQFINPANPQVHREGTGREIVDAMEGLEIHGFCAGVGTGGSMTGVGETLKKSYPDIEIWAVEPEEAAILTDAKAKIGSHMQMGIGDGLIPENLNTEIYDEVCVVSDDDAISCAKALARDDGLLCGISSGSNVAAAKRLAKKLGKGKTVVTILPDTGERYFSTVLFE